LRLYDLGFLIIAAGIAAAIALIVAARSAETGRALNEAFILRAYSSRGTGLPDESGSFGMSETDAVPAFPALAERIERLRQAAAKARRRRCTAGRRQAQGSASRAT
jgi:hypothetical protein